MSEPTEDWLLRFEPRSPRPELKETVLAACVEGPVKRKEWHMLESRWSKVVVLGIFLSLFSPIYFLSDHFLGKRAEALWGLESDPRTPEKLLTVAWIYDCTWRPEQADEIAGAWLRRYGGDERAVFEELKGRTPAIERYLQWEAPWWTDDAPRPEAWSKDPHPLTASVLCLLAEHLERNRHYLEARHLYTIVARKFSSDKVSVEKAAQGLLRDRTRSF